MEYYLLEVASEYYAPYPLKWYETFDVNAMKDGIPKDTSKQKIIFVKDDVQMVFTDIICTPCFMVSKTVRDTIWLYDSSIFFDHIILLSKEQRRSETYYIPILDEINCICPPEVDDVKNKHALDTVNIIKDRIHGKAIFRAAIDNTSRIFINMDLANSILRRETIGVGLKVVKCI